LQFHWKIVSINFNVPVPRQKHGLNQLKRLPPDSLMLPLWRKNQGSHIDCANKSLIGCMNIIDRSVIAMVQQFNANGGHIRDS